jgi:transcriptional regulator with XRE-family HTH domain
MNPTKDVCSKGGNALTARKLAQLARARARRRIERSVRIAPVGWKSMEDLLWEVDAYRHRHRSALLQLAEYIGVNESSVRRWLKGAKRPVQRRLDQIAEWMRRENAKRRSRSVL